MAEPYKKRGKAKADLTLHYSPKSKVDVALAGEVELLHFFHAESDPDVASANYAPGTETSRLVGEHFSRLIGATVKTRDGKTIWRRLAAEQPTDDREFEKLSDLVAGDHISHVSRVESWTKELLIANPIRIRNSVNALSWITAAKFWPLIAFKELILNKLKNQREIAFSEVIHLGNIEHRPLYGAAALELAYCGSLNSDLDVAPFGGNTIFYSRDRSNRSHETPGVES